MINERFIQYFRENFFSENEEELSDFLEAIKKPIPRTIRIKPGKEKEVIKRLENDGWIPGKTNIYNVFSMDRREDFDPLERRLGFSLDHLVGNFYIQELAAAHPVSILADWKIQDKEFLILDMAASPGGKTTQLAEYFPNSFIIANEPTRERIPQLLQNLERMGMSNIGITLYPWQFWKWLPETFDRILLDAPCSGEWTLYKWTDAVKHWHIKNIKQIAHLQTKLLESALCSLKVWWEMIYSTCSLNLLENEWVLESMRSKYPQVFEVVFEKKFWPHIDGTGWFFVAKIRKIASISTEKNQWIFHNSNEWLHKYTGNIWSWKSMKNHTLYEYDKKILSVKNAQIAESLRQKIYPMRWGEILGDTIIWDFRPYHQAFRLLENTVPRYELLDENHLDEFLRGNEIGDIGEDWYVLVCYMDEPISLEQRISGAITNSLPKEWQRK